MEQYRLQQRLFQEGYDGEQPWDTRAENQNTTTEVETAPEIEETTNEEEWRILKDNQLWEKQDINKENNPDPAHEGEVGADGTIEKGLGPTDALVQAGNPYGFQPHTMKLLEKDEDKADWQDKDPIIALVKNWVKEG